MSDTPQLPVKPTVLTTEELPIFTSDPATFLVANAIVNRVRDSVSELRLWLTESRPDLEIVLEVVLARMQRAKQVDIVDDRIIILKSGLYMDMADAKVASSLHKVAQIVMGRIHEHLTTDPARHFPDDLRWMALPDHPLIAKRLAALSAQYQAELAKLRTEIANDPELRGDQVRFTMLFNGPLKPEDF